MVLYIFLYIPNWMHSLAGCPSQTHVYFPVCITGRYMNGKYSRVEEVPLLVWIWSNRSSFGPTGREIWLTWVDEPSHKLILFFAQLYSTWHVQHLAVHVNVKFAGFSQVELKLTFLWYNLKEMARGVFFASRMWFWVLIISVFGSISSSISGSLLSLALPLPSTC